MMKLVYPACFSRPGDGNYTVEVPDLPGCVSGGPIGRCHSHGGRRCQGWVLDELEEGNPVPPCQRHGHRHTGRRWIRQSALLWIWMPMRKSTGANLYEKKSDDPQLGSTHLQKSIISTFRRFSPMPSRQSISSETNLSEHRPA